MRYPLRLEKRRCHGIFSDTDGRSFYRSAWRSSCFNTDSENRTKTDAQPEKEHPCIITCTAKFQGLVSPLVGVYRYGVNRVHPIAIPQVNVHRRAGVREAVSTQLVKGRVCVGQRLIH
jgi:hypothetical protein